jgi:hypothetical protein
MREMYLDKLAMAGGEGRELLRRIKYEALREYRIQKMVMKGARNYPVAFTRLQKILSSQYSGKGNEVEEKYHCEESRFFTNKRRFFAMFGPLIRAPQCGTIQNEDSAF